MELTSAQPPLNLRVTFARLRAWVQPRQKYVLFTAMKKVMKAGAKSMTKGAIAEALATSCELKKSVCAKVLESLAEVATTNVKKAGVFAIPGLCRLKIRTKPATKAGKREVFGKVVMVKAKPA